MTKTENRAAAKAYAQEKERRRLDLAREAAVAADLEPLGRLRRYLIFERRSDVPPTT